MCTLKELFLVNPKKNNSERMDCHHSYKLATMLKMCFVTDVFLGS